MKIYIVYENYDNDEYYEDHDYYKVVSALCATKEKAMEYISEINPSNDDYDYEEGAKEKWETRLERKGAIRIFHTEEYGSYPHIWYTISEREVLE